ncbi:MAG: gamma-glutamylcyclotransferase family protein, partial [Nitrososphaerota archaeon]
SPSWRGGVANIVEDENNLVYGAVYKINRGQLERLDEAVGVPRIFFRRKVVVEVEGIGSVESVTYLSTSGRGRWVKPSEQYVSVLLKGLKQLRYDDDIIQKIKRMATEGQVE